MTTFAVDQDRKAAQGSTFNDYENPFAYQTETYAPPKAPRVEESELGTKNTYNFTSKPSNSPSGYMRHRINAILRGLAFLATLAVVLVLANEKIKSKGNADIHAIITYKYAGAFVFFVYVNGVVTVYMLVLLIISVTMARKGGASQPKSLMWPIFVLDLVACGFLLLAFAAALALQVGNSRGMTLQTTDVGLIVIWRPLCADFEVFCYSVDICLGASALAFLAIVGGTCIDAQDIYMYRRYLN